MNSMDRMKIKKSIKQNVKITKRKPAGFLQVIERRHFIRHPLSFPLVYKVLKPAKGEAGERVSSETINVSMGGLLFPSKYPVKLNSLVEIQMPFENKLFKLKAKVVRCVANSETKLYDVGVSFCRMHEAFKAKMIEQIYLISEYRDLLSLQLGKVVSMEEASRRWIKRYSQRFKRLYW